MRLNTLQAKLVLGNKIGMLLGKYGYETTFRVNKENPHELLSLPMNHYGEGLLDAILGYHNFLIEKELKRKPELHRDYEQVSKLIGTTPVYHPEGSGSVKDSQVIWINDGITGFNDFELKLNVEIQNMRDRRRNTDIVKTYNAYCVNFGKMHDFKKEQEISCGLSYSLL